MNRGRIAFVFAADVGMLRALTPAGVTADFVVGSSIGAINAYYASDPTVEAGNLRVASSWSPREFGPKP